MTCTYEQFIDDTFKMFNDAWQSGAGAIVGSDVPPVYWVGKESKTKPPLDNYWARVSTQGVVAPQSTMKSGIAPDEKQRYTPAGLLFVQLFCPMGRANSFVIGRRLSMLVQDTFRGAQSPNGVWFRNVRINEIDPDSNAYRFNIVAEYEYDDIG